MSIALAVEYAARQFEPAARRYATPYACALACEPNTKQTPALALIDAELVRVLDTEGAQTIIGMPPQEGKSQRVSRWFVLWALVCNPKLRIAIVSFEYGRARRWGQQVKRDIENHPELGLTIRKDTSAAGQWQTTQGGGVYCVGIAGALTGEPVDLLVIDDPVKDRAQAESKLYRDRAWDFWENVAKVRARKTVLVMTRWHADDLAGRLDEREPGDWRKLYIPAIADAPNDPLGRAIGEEMQSVNDRRPGYFKKFQSSISPYVFTSLYQQHPTAAEGGVFKRADWRYWNGPYNDPGGGTVRINLGDGEIMGANTHRLSEMFTFFTLDLASSIKTGADYTVACAWGITVAGDLVLLDRVRDQVAEVDHAALLLPLRQRWAKPYDVVHVESRMFGTTLVYALGKAGLPVAELHADADKLTRALSGAGLVRQHKVWLPQHAGWLDEWIDEHADFPNVAHDDQVDNLAYAARVAIAHWLPPQDAESERATEDRARRAEAEQAPLDPVLGRALDLDAATW